MKLLELNLVSSSVQTCCCQNCKAPWWSVGHYHSTYHVILFYFQLKAEGADLGRAQNAFFDSYWISLYTWQEKLDQKVSFSDFENSMFFGWFPIRGAYVHFKTSQCSKAILWLFREHLNELKKKKHLHLHVHVQNITYLAVWVSDNLEEKQKTKKPHASLGPPQSDTGHCTFQRKSQAHCRQNSREYQIHHLGSVWWWEGAAGLETTMDNKIYCYS